MSINYRHCYDLLGLDADASWEDLRKSYKLLVQQNHPDRFERDPEAKKIAEMQVREINNAHQVLADYFQTHRRLPFGKAPARSHANWEFQNTSGLESRDEEREVQKGRSPLATVVSKWVVLGVPAGLILLVIGVLLSQFNGEQGVPEVENAGQPLAAKPVKTLPPTRAAKPAFQYGDSSKRVLEVQGKPTRIAADSWFYGRSRVDFQQGHVVGWQIEKGSPLRVAGTLPGQKQKLIGIGASMEDVLAIQGAPVMKSERRWDYGTSYIEFKDAKVVSWFSSVLRPLAVREKPKSKD